MSDSSRRPAVKSSLHTLLGVPDDAPIILSRLSVLDWGRTLVFEGAASGQPFELRFTDCRDLRWRVYVHEQAHEQAREQGDAALLVSFAPGRDLQRSPAQILTEQFGLSVFYGSMTFSSRIQREDEC
jgi:hypothetical protein